MLSVAFLLAAAAPARADTTVPVLMGGWASAVRYDSIPWTLQKTGVFAPGSFAGTGVVTWTIDVGRNSVDPHFAIVGYVEYQNMGAVAVPVSNLVINLQQSVGGVWTTVSSDIADTVLGDAANQAVVDPNLSSEYKSLFQENGMSGALTFTDSGGSAILLNSPALLAAPGATRIYFAAEFKGALSSLSAGTLLRAEIITSYAPGFGLTSDSNCVPVTVPAPVIANDSVTLLDNSVTATGTVAVGAYVPITQLLAQGGSFTLSVPVDGKINGGQVCNTAMLTSQDTTIPFVFDGVSVPLIVVPGINLSATNCQPVPPRDTPHPVTLVINSCSQVVTYDASLFTSPNGTIVSANFIPQSGHVFPFGISTVQYSVTDSAGVTATGTFTVNVSDTEAPVIAPVPDVMAVADDGGCSAIVQYSTTASDCNLASLTFTPASGSTFPVGVTVVTIRATDTAGHESTSTFSVTVKDLQPPVITSPLTDLVLQPDSGNCTAHFVYTPTAVDNCTSAVTVSVSPASGSNFPAGSTTLVTVTATDSSGNITTGNFTVHVADCPPPGLKLTKSANPAVATPFAPVTYTYTVTNTGGSTLQNIVVKDDNGTPQYAGDDFVVGTIASLAPGASGTLTATVIPPVSLVAIVNGGSVPAGTIILANLPNGDIKATYLQSFGVNDNTYGTGVIGWPGGNHTFSHLLKSDQAEFRFLDAAGHVVLDFRLDYLDARSSITVPGSGQIISYPSGYGCAGPFGGDGAMISGNANNIVTFTTSLTANLNAAANLPFKVGLIVNSPTSLVSGNVVVNSTKAPGGWDYFNSYTVVVKSATFGGAGFGSLAIPSQHNSPSKIGCEQLCPKPTNGSVTNTATATCGTLTATASATVTIGTPPPPPATGTIGSLVWVDQDGDGLQDAGEPGLPGITVTLKNSSGVVIATDVTDGDGVYEFDGLNAGSYTVVVATPSGYTATPKLVGTNRAIDSNGSPATVTLATSSSVDLTIDFGFKPSTPCAKPLLTYTQGGWGAQPRGNNPGALLTKYFGAVYPGGYVGIGTTARNLVFTSASAIIKFLPQGGTPATLAASAFNPCTSTAGEFAGQVLALRLNVDFSNAGRTAAGLAGKHVASGPLAGRTVNDVLTIANSVLAGGTLPSGVTLPNLNEIVTAINENYESGKTNEGFLY